MTFVSFMRIGRYTSEMSVYRLIQPAPLVGWLRCLDTSFSRASISALSALEPVLVIRIHVLGFLLLNSFLTDTRPCSSRAAKWRLRFPAVRLNFLHFGSDHQYPESVPLVNDVIDLSCGAVHRPRRSLMKATTAPTSRTEPGRITFVAAPSQ